ncbi:MAG: DUF4234 domain-containing protein [Myxococcales bacterium]|nr:DUF4234 domain-containing protein [Myxococcales bacterium]
MGYRNETEHLRHRVEQLEGEIASLKGARRNGKEELFDGRVKRQTVLLVGLALVASASVGLCALPTAVAVLERANDALPLDQVARDTTHREATFEGTLDLTTVFDVGYYNHAAPLVEDPRIIVSCGWDCPYGVEAELTDRFDARRRSFRGRIYPSGAYEFDRVDGPSLEEHARQHGLSVDDLRVVELRHDEDPRPALFAMVFLVSMAALALWVAVFWHRRASRAEVPLPTALDYQTREPGTTLLLTIVTCRLYELVWIYQSTAQVRRLTGRRDLIPALDVLLSVATLGLWSFWVFYRNVEAVDEALADTGFHAPQTGAVVGLTLGSFVCGVLHWVLIYKVQEAYNLLAIQKLE